jgi:signal transduction histidine kinase
MQVFTSLLVLGIFFGVYVITDVRSYKQRKVNSMISLAQVIATNSISTLEFQDNEAAKDILSDLRQVAPEVTHASITDVNGKPFANYARRGTDTLFTPPDLDDKSSLFTDKQFYVRKDIVTINNEVIGKVFLEVSLTELQEIKRSKFKIAGVLLCVAIGFCVLIAFLVQTYISKRLLSLVNNMKEVSRTGDYSKPIPDDGKDEISVLNRVFNSLMLQVKENQQRKDEFIGIASHELKTPLTSIKGYVELVNMMEDRQPNKQYVQKTLENINKLEKLIRDLLDVSKIQSGQLELNMKEFDIDALLDETVASIKIVSGDYEITRQERLNNQLILADRQRIEQVLINILSNAVKYSPGENKVMIYSKKIDGELIIRIRDFGVGIPVEEQSNIFERFYRTKDTSMNISGFGLGLYICRDIIKRHKGKIWVETEIKGSSFYFSLPLQNGTNKPTKII